MAPYLPALSQQPEFKSVTFLRVDIEACPVRAAARAALSHAPSSALSARVPAALAPRRRWAPRRRCWRRRRTTSTGKARAQRAAALR
jgi:hypothetical protein